MTRERALESSMEDLADSPSCISVSARRRGPRYLLGDLLTICQRSTGRVLALSNIYRTLLPSCVYCGELSYARMHVCTWPIGLPVNDTPKNHRFIPLWLIRILTHILSVCRVASNPDRNNLLSFIQKVKSRIRIIF